MRTLKPVHILIGLAPWFSLAPPTYAAPPQVNGKLDTLAAFRVLHVWGTPAEMGFAHGYLLADDIIIALDEQFAVMPPQERQTYDRKQAQFVPAINLPERAKAEIQGILAGIKAAKNASPNIPSLGRALALNDLILRNAGDTLRAFGCSGYTAWGEKTGPLDVVTTRNFDFAVPGPKSLALQMLLVRHPKDRTPVASVTWPGYIGAFTAVNERGVCAFLHDGTGGRLGSPQGKYVPLALILADFLERAEPKSAQSLAETSLKSIVPYPFSYLVRVVTPMGEDSTQKPSRVFRVDPQGFSENVAGPLSCITTNHYLLADGKAAPQANEWSLKRYERLTNNLETIVTPESAWAGLAAVASDNQSYPTVHSLIVYPDRQRLDLAFATWDQGRVVPAALSKPAAITFGQLFETK